MYNFRKRSSRFNILTDRDYSTLRSSSLVPLRQIPRCRFQNHVTFFIYPQEAIGERKLTSEEFTRQSIGECLFIVHTKYFSAPSMHTIVPDMYGTKCIALYEVPYEHYSNIQHFQQCNQQLSNLICQNCDG